LGLTEEPMGILYSDEKPADGFSPKAMDLPTREKEQKNEIDWQAVFGRFLFMQVLGSMWFFIKMSGFQERFMASSAGKRN